MTDRASLINDAFSLSESGHLDYHVPLSMVQYLRRETGLVPWQAAATKLAQMESLLRSTDAYPMYRKVGKPSKQSVSTKIR